MSALMELLLAVAAGSVAGVLIALALLGINRRTEGDDAEERRAVSRPAELDDAEQMRRGGLL